MVISQHKWHLLVRFIITIQLIALVPDPTSAKPASLGERSLQLNAEELQLLQQSLSITELNKNINRISVQEIATAQKRKQIETVLQREEVAFSQKREQASRILCSYYIGERDSILQTVLADNQVHNMLLLFEYFQLLLQADHDILSTYKEQINTLRQLRKQNRQLEKELSEVRNRLVIQRNRLAKLQKQLNAHVATSNNPAAMNKLIQEFLSYWQNVGLHEVRYYFRALAKSMKKLPHFIKSKGHIRIQGINYMVTIREELLNQFLQEQDPMFKVLTFQFKDGVIAAEGYRSGMIVRVEGHYTIESEPINNMLFHIDHIFFNRLELPKSTHYDLEQSFDLSFYPKQLVPFIEAREVAITDKMITVKLSLRL